MMRAKRFLCAATALILLFSFAACGKSGGGNAAESSEAFSSSTAAALTSAATTRTEASKTAAEASSTKRVFHAAGSVRSSLSLIITDIYARGEGIGETQLPKNPATTAQFIEYFKYFIGNRVFELRIPVSEEAFRQAGEFAGGKDAANKCAYEICSAVSVLYPELGSKNNLGFAVSYYPGANPYILIARKAPATREEFADETDKYNRAVAKAKSVAKTVQRSLPAGFTDYDLASALIMWLTDNCAYDEDMADIGYTAYGALVGGEASCVGYTAGCAMLLKAAGISCVEVNSEKHSWVALKLGGKIYWADPTFADNNPGYDEKYLPSNDFSVYEDDGQHSPLYVDFEETKKLWK